MSNTDYSQASPQSAAVQLRAEISRRTAGYLLSGLLLWASIELIRFYWFPSFRAWSFRGGFMPFLILGTFGVIISQAALLSALGSQPKISKPIRDEELVQAFATGDTETIRIVRGLAACMYIVAFLYGCLISLLIASLIV